MSWIPWDGHLTVGAVTIGAVNQGTGGSSAWKVDGSAVTQPVSQAEYKSVVEYNGSNLPVYVGLTLPGVSHGTADAVWQIRKFTYDGSSNLTYVAFPSNSNAFTFTWDDRASYTYA